MYAVLAEDRSDVETLTVLIRRLAGSDSMQVRQKGYDGCGELLRKGARQLQLFHDLGDCERYVVCYDSDRDDPAARHERLIDKVIAPSGLTAPICALVPIQEIEAWILADVKAVTKVLTGWVPGKAFLNPETIKDPKEHLERMSRMSNQRPRYIHATHNSKVAKHLDLALVMSKCPSFVPLFDIVTNGRGNT